MLRKTFFILFFLWLLFLRGSGTEPVLLNNDSEIYSLVNKLEYFEDDTNQLTVSDLSNLEYSSQFKPVVKKTPNFGYSSSNIWIRFRIRKNLSESRSWVLEISYPPLDNLEFYYPSDVGEYSVRTSGENYKFYSRDIQYRNFVFLFPEQIPEEEYFYIKVNSASVLMVPIRIISYSKFINIVNRDQLWMGIYFGALMVIILYNLFLYISVKDLRYLWYVAFILVWGISQAVWQGFGFEYLWPAHPGWANTAMPFFYAMTSFFTLRFAQEFLETKKYSKFLNYLIIVLTVCSAILVILTLFLNYRLSIQLSDIMAAISASMFVISAFICWRRGFELGVYYFSAFLVLALCVLLNVLASFAIIPTGFLTRHGVEIGVILGVTLLSMGLGASINILKAEKAQAETIARATKKLVHYFPRTLVYKIITSPEAVLPTSARKQVTVFFTDLMGFTDLTESHEPELVKSILNEYLAEMQNIIDQLGATLDKFLGDGLMGYFGALDDLSKDEQAELSVTMAIEMQLRLHELRKKWKKQGITREIKMRIGIHQDFVTIGNFGSSELMSYTAIGNGVNLASRLEHSCTPGKIQVSHRIYELTKDKFNYGSIQEKKLKGISRIQKVVELDPVPTHNFKDQD